MFLRSNSSSVAAIKIISRFDANFCLYSIAAPGESMTQIAKIFSPLELTHSISNRLNRKIARILIVYEGEIGELDLTVAG